MLIAETPFTLRKWTVKEYHKLGEMGIFHPEERVELIEGNIITMSAKGTAHTSALGRTDRLFQDLFHNLAWVRVQDPIALDGSSEPEPDIALVIIDSIHSWTADEYIDLTPSQIATLGTFNSIVPAIPKNNVISSIASGTLSFLLNLVIINQNYPCQNLYTLPTTPPGVFNPRLTAKFL